jgi:large subunit ribosomal protein L31
VKKNIHPKYGFVLFRCPGTGTEILTRSTKLNGSEHAFQGTKIPSIAVEICSDNHPFYSGKAMVIDTAGRVDAFKKRFAKSEQIKSAAPAKEAAPAASAEAAPKPKPKPAPKQKRPEAELPKLLKAQELERANARAEKMAKGGPRKPGDKPAADRGSSK